MKKENKLKLLREKFLSWMFFKSPKLSRYFGYNDGYNDKKVEIEKWIDEVDPNFLDIINGVEYGLSDIEKIVAYSIFPFFVYGKGKEKKIYQKYAAEYLMERYPVVFNDNKNIKKFFELYINAN